MQIAVINVSSVVPNHFNDEVILRVCLGCFYGLRVTFAGVLALGTPSIQTPRSGMSSVASLNRLVKFAMQIVRVNSTICPSS